MRTACEAIAEDHRPRPAPPHGRGYAARRTPPDGPGAATFASPGAPAPGPPAPGRTGVTFGYMKWWVISLAYDVCVASSPVSYVTRGPAPAGVPNRRTLCARLARPDHGGAGAGPCAGGGRPSTGRRAS